MRTDGQPFGRGLLYQLEFTSPGEFAQDFDAVVMPASQIQRTRTDDAHCR